MKNDTKLQYARLAELAQMAELVLEGGGRLPHASDVLRYETLCKTALGSSQGVLAAEFYVLRFVVDRVLRGDADAALLMTLQVTLRHTRDILADDAYAEARPPLCSGFTD